MSEILKFKLEKDLYVNVDVDENFDESMRKLMSEVEYHHILKIVNYDNKYIKYVPENISKQKFFMKHCLEEGIDIENISSFLYEDPELMLFTFNNFYIKQKPLDVVKKIFNLCDESLKNNLIFNLQAVTVNPILYQFIKDEFKNNKGVKLIVAKQGDMQAFPLDMLNDRDFAIELCLLNGEIIRDLPEIFKNDKEIAQIALSQNINAFVFLPESLQNDLELLTYFSLSFLKNDYQEDDITYYEEKMEIMKSLILKEEMKKEAVKKDTKKLVKKF